MYGCGSWTIKLSTKELMLLNCVVLEKTLESPLDCKEINQSILKEISPEYSLEGLTLKLELQYILFFPFILISWRLITIL